jgi:hypothetical protein
MSAAARAQSPRHALGPCKKFVATRRDFIRSEIDPKLAWFLIVLEDQAMDRTRGFDDPWGIVYDADLASFGSEDTIRRLWLKAEEGGYLRRVQIKDASGHVTGRVGFIWLCRPSDHPVATPDTLDQAAADLRAAATGRKDRARTVPMHQKVAQTPRSFAGGRPAVLRGDAPQFCGGTDAPPYLNRARDGSQTDTEETTTTRAGESSSFFDPSTQNQEPERPSTPEPLGPVPSDPIPAVACTHVEAEDPPAVPELPTELAVNQVLLVAIIAQVAKFFGKTIEQARAAVVTLFGEFRATARIRGFRFELKWFEDALSETERAKAAGRIKTTPWVYFRGILDKYARQGGPVRDGPTCHQAQQTLDELASYGQTIVIKPDGSVAHGRTRADACPWEELPESLRRKVKEQKDPILAIIRARTSSPPTENARL